MNVLGDVGESYVVVGNSTKEIDDAMALLQRPLPALRSCLRQRGLSRHLRPF
jgi:hypothetical protein